MTDTCTHLSEVSGVVTTGDGCSCGPVTVGRRDSLRRCTSSIAVGAGHSPRSSSWTACDHTGAHPFIGSHRPDGDSGRRSPDALAVPRAAAVRQP